MSTFEDGYIEAALWSSLDDKDRPLDANYTRADFAPETARLFAAECAEFQRQNASELAKYMTASDRPEDFAGHDFWLTRNGHGTGFWDRGAGVHGDALTQAAGTWGELYLYVGDDGKLYA